MSDGDEGGILPQTSCQGGERQDQMLSDRQIRHPSSLISLSFISLNSIPITGPELLCDVALSCILCSDEEMK